MKLKVQFIVPSKDLKKSESMVLPVTTSVEGNGTIYGDIEYSVVMPDFMFKELADTEPQFRTKYDPNGGTISGLFSEKSITRKFKKTQTAKLISTLQHYFSDITQFINDKHSIETETIKKKLFIDFTSNINHTKNSLNAAYMGEQVSQSFRYFTGYEVMTDKFSDTFNKKVEKKYISKILYYPKGSTLAKLDTNFQEKNDLFITLLNTNQSVKDFENRYIIIDWTQEREDFFKTIKEKFKEINEQLKSFINNIDDNKIEELMTNSNLKMLQ